MRGCCDIDPVVVETKVAAPSPGLRGRLGRIGAWIAPAAGLALMPKCPMCIAAYIAIWTGAGISISAASHLRTFTLILCGAALAYLTAGLLRGSIMSRLHRLRS